MHLNLGGKEGLPLILCGQSLGGGVCFQLAIQNPKAYNLVILLAPAIMDWKQNMAGLKKMLGIAAYLVPKLPTIKLTPGQGFRNPQVNDDNEKDPLLYKGRFYPATGNSAVSMMNESESKYHLLDTPFIIVQGGVDKLCNPNGAFELMKKSKTK